MPRLARLDAPGVLHHVMGRGIERKNIFWNDKDRSDFIDRLAGVVEKGGMDIYAWTLMPNHVHLLIRTSNRPLGDLMRKVLTGYAIFFNRRHGRHGYLYQNRYKSILCQEDEYLLELVRYIHLNPVRAGVVKSLSELDRYRWSGHSVLVGRRRRTWQDRGEILSHFGLKKREAVKRYREFIEDGFNMGRREDLTGGGLRRSAGGWEGVFELRRAKEYWRGDERILGDGDFVNEVLKLSEEELTHKEELKRQGWDLGRIVDEVCRMLSVDPDDLDKKGRANDLSSAKGLICYLGYYQLGINGKELARHFGISRPSVSQAIKRGEKFAKENNDKLLS